MSKLAPILLALLAGPALAQAGAGDAVKLRRQDGSSISVEAGRVSVDTELTGVTVINGEVYIDGDKVPAGTKSFKGRKSGKTYQISWDKNGNVSVAEK